MSKNEKLKRIDHIDCTQTSHQGAINVIKNVDDYNFLTGGNDKTMKVWKIKSDGTYSVTKTVKLSD